MPQREELTDVEKAQIVVLSHHENATEIGNELHIARCPVSSFYNDIININSLKIFPAGKTKENICHSQWMTRPRCII